MYSLFLDSEVFSLNNLMYFLVVIPIFSHFCLKIAIFFTNRQKWHFAVSKKSIIFANAIDLACRGIDGQNVDAN